MPINTQARKSSRLLLYGLAFRILGSVALRTPDQKPVRAARQHDARRRPLQKERVPLPLELDAGR